MTVLVQVEVEVDCEKMGMEVNKTEVNKVEASVKEAIRECLQRGEDMGFNHPLADKTSLFIGRIRATAVHCGELE